MDHAENLGTASRLQNIEVRSDNWRSYKEASFRLSGDTGSFLVYRSPGEYVEFQIHTFEHGLEPKLTINVSSDGVSWEQAAPQVAIYASSESNYDYLIPRQYTLSCRDCVDARYVKLDFVGKSDIVRVELDYVPN